MGKEITLPWTCKQGDYIKSGLVWFIAITGPLCLAYICYQLNLQHGYDKNALDGLIFCYGVLGSIFGWMIKLTSWDMNNSIPSFKCKSDDTSQKESTK